MKTVPCAWCGRQVPRQWHNFFLHAPRCGPERAEVERCEQIVRAMLTEPPEEEIWYEQPPDDIDICPYCNSDGEVFVRQDWATGAYITEPCGPCRGTGRVDPQWLPRVSY